MGVLVAVAGLFGMFAIVGPVAVVDSSVPAPSIALELPSTGLHPTHASIAASASDEAAGATELKYQLEYATSAGGPWTVAESGERVFGPGERHLWDFGMELHHLSPLTAYFVRAKAEFGAVELERTISFTTPATAAPEIFCRLSVSGECASQPITPEVGAYEASFRSRIESNGLEAQYSAEYSEGKPGPPWTPIVAGTISVAQDYLELSHTLKGLSPATTYYVHVTAKNAKGSVEATQRVDTDPPYPDNPNAREAVNVEATSARVRGGVNPRSAETHWRLEYITQKGLEEGGSWSVGPGGTIAAGEAGEASVPLEAMLTGLQPGTVYDVRLFADNGHPPAQTQTLAPLKFETAGAPVVETFVTHALNGEAMRGLGVVQPHGYDTHYFLEYVSERQFREEGEVFQNAAATPEVDAGAGAWTGTSFPSTVVGVDLPASLAAGETYRYRLTASSVAPGDPLVHGEERTLTVPVAAAEGGGEACSNRALRTGPSASLPDCRAYEQVTPVEKGATQDTYKYDSNGEHTVVGLDGDHVLVEAPGVQWGPTPDPLRSVYVFSRDPSAGWQMTSARPAGETGGVSYGEVALWTPSFEQLAFDRVGWATTPAGTLASREVQARFGPPGGPYTTVASYPRSQFEEFLVASSPDFSTLVLASEDRELAGHPTGTTSGSDLYEWHAGVLRQLNVIGETSPIGKCGATLARRSAHAVSADGRRVFFAAVPGESCGEQAHVYMRVDGTETVDLGIGRFVAADPEGTKVLLERRGSGEKREFVLYETSSRTTRVLLSAQGVAQSFVSDDLGTIYIESTTPLSSGKLPSGLNDLYRYDVATGSLEFLFQLDEEGKRFVSADGRYLYFTSREVSGVPGGKKTSSYTEFGWQVYRYDNGEGVVQCMSCASSFDPEPRLEAFFTLRDVSQYSSQLPASANGDYAFFVSLSALVPTDTDGETPLETAGAETSASGDVYEWRRAGVDGCAHAQGCLALITSGRGSYKSEFLGVDPSGRDVFFATHESLTPSDRDTAGDVYDARIGGGFSPLPPQPVECEGDACSTPPAPPNDLTPSSATFGGPGNLVATLPQATPRPEATRPKPKAKTKCRAKSKRGCKQKTRSKARRKSGRSARARHLSRSARSGR